MGSLNLLESSFKSPWWLLYKSPASFLATLSHAPFHGFCSAQLPLQLCLAFLFGFVVLLFLPALFHGFPFPIEPIIGKEWGVLSDYCLLFPGGVCLWRREGRGVTETETLDGDTVWEGELLLQRGLSARRGCLSGAETQSGGNLKRRNRWTFPDRLMRNPFASLIKTHSS